MVGAKGPTEGGAVRPRKFSTKSSGVEIECAWLRVPPLPELISSLPKSSALILRLQRLKEIDGRTVIGTEAIATRVEPIFLRPEWDSRARAVRADSGNRGGKSAIHAGSSLQWTTKCNVRACVS